MARLDDVRVEMQPDVGERAAAHAVERRRAADEVAVETAQAGLEAFVIALLIVIAVFF